MYDTCNYCNEGALSQAEEVKEIQASVRKYANEKFTVWRCPSCDMIHASELVDLAKYYKDFPMHRQEMTVHVKIGFNIRLQCLKKLGFTRSSYLLDYGCGSGLFVQYLNAKGYSNVFGYDPFSEKYSDSNVLEQRYEFVTSQDVIEHADDPSEEVKLVSMALKVNGYYVVGTPRAERIDLQNSDRYNVHIGQPFHRHIFTEKRLRFFIESFGFLETNDFPVSDSYFDSFFPGANERFILEYLFQTGGMLDVAIEEPQFLKILTSPRLLFFLYFGKLFSPKASMTKIYRKTD